MKSLPLALLTLTTAPGFFPSASKLRASNSQLPWSRFASASTCAE
jgi:hypothetical protein